MAYARRTTNLDVPAAKPEYLGTVNFKLSKEENVRTNAMCHENVTQVLRKNSYQAMVF